MKLMFYIDQGAEKTGVVTEKGILPLPYSRQEVIRRHTTGLKLLLSEALSEDLVSESGLKVLPCIPAGGKIVCVGLNYREHAKEAGMPVPEYPVLFNKFDNTLSAHGEEIVLPSVALHYDYEAELGVVIGKTASRVSEEMALDYVFGYCNVNDLSARDLQMRTGQWMLGKTLDGFCPIGPYLVTADEVGDPNELEIKLMLNGEIRQHSNTRDMIFSVPEIVSYVSRYMTLQPGDLILTGTPQGVIAGYPEERRVWLKPGDEVSVTISKLGTLTNRMKGEDQV
jgi:2-keto-4-pentenoate hydratase/2-oxohepta-3-ene-1,7-dioic acid hydratase in catechol pathway